MTFEFRPSTPLDGALIAELCERVLQVPARSPVFSPAHMRWKYWEPYPAWQGSRSFLLFKQLVPIAHAGLVPLRFSREGRTYTLVQLIDWAADPKHVGAGAVLLKRIVALADGAVSVRGSSMTQRIVKPLGFRSFGETLQYAAVARPVTTGPRTSIARTATVRIHERGPSTVREHPLSTAQSSDARIVIQHDNAQIRAWLDCPVVRMRYGEVLLGARLLGSFLLACAPRQARIAHAWADREVEAAFDAVIELAYRHGCEEQDATEVVCQSNDPEQGRALLDNGFEVVGADPLAVLSRTELVPDGASFPHHLIDSDLAYLHHGVPDLWLPSNRPST